MKITASMFGTTVVRTVDIVDYKPNYEAAISYRDIGGKWLDLDKGFSRDHFSSTVTLSDTYETLHYVRDTLVAASSYGATVSLEMSQEESIFGCCFNYERETYECFVLPPGPFESVAPEGNKLATLDITFLSKQPLQQKLLYPAAEFPNDWTFAPVQVTRSSEVHSQTGATLSTHFQVGLRTNAKSFSLRWCGTRKQMAEAVSYLINQRSRPFILTSGSSLYYNIMETASQTVSVADITEYGFNSSTHGYLEVNYLVHS
jgi:hypothetical protein